MKTEYTTDTKGQIKIHTFTWTIPDFYNLLRNKATKEFRTEKPEDAKQTDFRFQLKMQFLGRDNDIIEFYYLSPSPVFLKSRLSCRDQVFKKEYQTVQAIKWQHLATFLKCKLLKTPNLYLQTNHSLCLTFQFKVPNGIYVTPTTQLTHNLEHLLHTGLFSDATMKSAEGKEYKVHKAVLANCSAVLKAHFEQNTVECQTNIVESSLEAEVLIEVLTFIYSDKAPQVDEIPEKLLAAADYYQLSRLKSLCEEALHKRLTVENAIETLQLADLHSAKILKQLTLEFIKDGQAKLITKTEGWAKVKSVELIKTICEYITANDIGTTIKELSKGVIPNTNYTTRTEGPTKITTLIWTIPDFTKIFMYKFTRELRTEKPKDAATELIDSRFQLKMQFLGRNYDIVEIYYSSPNPVFLKSTLTICANRKEHSVVTKEYHTVQGNKWQYLATLFKEDILSLDMGNKLLLNDNSLRLKFEFMFSNDIKVDRANVPETQLSHDFENLLSNRLFSDVTMKSAEGEEYKVHKGVLASRSAVLKAHFEHNTIECQTNVVESSLEAEVLIEVLTFIYSDKAPRVDEIPEKLLAAADYYQLSRLKSLCEEALHKRLTEENAIETLQLADLHSSEILKQLTLEFIKDNQFKLITKTESWAKLKSVELIKTIYEYITADDIEPISETPRNSFSPFGFSTNRW